jgi:basic amino acid/polyamine antiporter, APA family
MKILDFPEKKTVSTVIRPQLGVFDLSMIVVSLVIGMGIFRTPPEVAQAAKVPLIFFLAWITGAVISLIGALTFAEIGSRYPAAGGFYKIFSHCYHPAFAFMVNWITVISNAASTAGVAIMGAEYIAPLLLPGWEHTLAVRIITISAVVLLYVINLLGIRISAKLLNGLMIIKISLLLALIFTVFKIIFPSSDLTLPSSIPIAIGIPLPSSGLPLPSPEFLPMGDAWKAFLVCFIPVFFTYGGYQQTMNFGGDINNPAKTLPRSIFFGIGIVLVLYLGVNYSYYKVLGFENLQNSKALASDMIAILLGTGASNVVAVLMFFAVMAYVNVSVLSNPRICVAMAEDGVLPKIFARINPKTQVQEFTVTIFCLVIVGTIFFLSSFQKILEFVMFFDSISLIAAAAAIFILRSRAKKTGDPAGIFKMKGYPYLPILFMIVYLGVMAGVYLTNQEAFGIGALVFICSLPLYYIVRWAIGNKEIPSPPREG